MPVPRHLVFAALLGALFTAPARAQVTAPQRLDADDHSQRLARLAITGDLGLPPLPPVLPDSPRDDLLFADRFPVGQGPVESGAPPPPPPVEVILPAGEGGTGTEKPELFVYQLPAVYDADGPPHPMVIAYHGFGTSANSVAVLSTVDEECNERGWVYLSVTGIDDQLFGTPLVQQNVEAAIQWMLNGFNVDADRLYMVGFSMGGGVVASFTARRRDPDGVMIAALGLVSPSLDWTMTYWLGSPAIRQILKGPFNFGTNPNQAPFAYQQVSTLVFDPDSYPPPPGLLLPELSMGTNLGSTPVYLTYDVDDPVPDPAAQDPELAALLASLGGEVVTEVVSGTVDPDTGDPAPHSWAVLDEDALFDFLEGRVVERRPVRFAAQLDRSATVAWVDVVQREQDAFSWVDGRASVPFAAARVREVANVDQLVVHLDETPIPTSRAPVVGGSSADADGFLLEARGLPERPAYLLDEAGDLLPGVEVDPFGTAFTLDVAGGADRAGAVVHEPLWTSTLWSAPDPVTVGNAITAYLDGPAGSGSSWLVASLTEALVPVPGGTFLTASPLVTATVVELPVDPEGDLELPIQVVAALLGQRVFLQTATLDGAGAVASVSNMWVVHVDG